MQELYRDPHPHQFNEALNPLGRNRCNSNSQCDGFRTCSDYGWCGGFAGVEGVDYNVAPAKTTSENTSAEASFYCNKFRTSANNCDTKCPGEDAKDFEIYQLTCQLNPKVQSSQVSCSEQRKSSHDCNKTCPGEDPEDFQNYQLTCQLNQKSVLPPDTCKQDRLRNNDCSKSCPGETAKETELASLECQLAAVGDG